MPELPEVETVKKELNLVLPGAKVINCLVLRESVILGDPLEFVKRIKGLCFAEVERRGKYLLVGLSNKARLAVHLKMTGKLIFWRGSFTPGPHDRVVFLLDSGARLIYSDVRCFGKLVVLPENESFKGLEKLGPDALAIGFRELKERVRQSRVRIKVWLMDQRAIAGIGNIYASEILFDAGIAPETRACALDDQKIECLRNSIGKILRAAIEKNGTTISDFSRIDEKSGEFQNFLKVYGKKDQPCVCCGNPIQKLVQAQRSTFYCSVCQG